MNIYFTFWFILFIFIYLFFCFTKKYVAAYEIGDRELVGGFWDG